MKIGVLALQGDFSLHAAHLKTAGAMPVMVKQPHELEGCQGLIIPGGESTTLVKLMKAIDLFDAIADFSRTKPIFGTCAGAILVAKEVLNHPVDPLGLINITVERNAYGRQIDSFSGEIDISITNEQKQIEAVFIRAPKIRNCGPDVRVLGEHQGDPVIVENDSVLAATFHPELTDETLVHRYFIEKVRKH